MIKRELPSEYIAMTPRYMNYLNRDIWSEHLQPATWKAGDTERKVGICYRGSYTRDLDQKSYRLTIYNGADLQDFAEFHLNAEYLDPSFIRNKLSMDFFGKLGVSAPSAEPIRLYMNGTYEGVYLRLESVDRYFLRARGLPDGAIYYAIRNNANFSLLSEDKEIKKRLESGYYRKYGVKEDDGYVRELIYKINSVPRPDFREQIVRYIDVDNYIRWLAGVVCTQNYDGFTQNYAMYRNGETGLFAMIPWDYSGTWGRNYKAKPMDFDFVPITGFNTLTARILDVAEFRQAYRKKMEEVLESAFTVRELEPVIRRWHERLRPHVLEDPYKAKSISDFDREPERMIEFIHKRNRFLRDSLSELDE
ncbi:CotH kinase family protein [Paenibacillus sp. GYB003]|uniref:CotH kinase family protein n=1 Tax=Paenibacillus sp. GYB003 TaxID=2994392 RepID=UPI002F96B297